MKRSPLFWSLDKWGEPIPVEGVEAWVRSLPETAARRQVGLTVVGAVTISTVFLPCPSVGGHWETAKLSKASGCVIVDRCGGSREQAEAMHARHVAEQRAKAANHFPPTTTTTK